MHYGIRSTPQETARETLLAESFTRVDRLGRHTRPPRPRGGGQLSRVSGSVGGGAHRRAVPAAPAAARPTGSRRSSDRRGRRADRAEPRQIEGAGGWWSTSPRTVRLRPRSRQARVARKLTSRTAVPAACSSWRSGKHRSGVRRSVGSGREAHNSAGRRDLRHTGHTLSTQSRATPKDTTVRADQPPATAAMIYRHSNLERQREVAAGIDARMRALRGMGADSA